MNETGAVVLLIFSVGEMLFRKDCSSLSRYFIDITCVQDEQRATKTSPCTPNDQGPF